MNVQDIYTEYATVVYRYAMHLLKSKEESEDVTSEVFARLIKDLDHYKSHHNKKAWLLTVARNIIFDGYRKKRESLLPINVDGEYIEFADESTSVEESVFTSELIELIQKELLLLDESTSEIIILRVWDQLQFGEIAEVVNESESTVKLRFYRGIDKIKNNITSQGKTTKLHSIGVPMLLAGLGKLAGTAFYIPSSTVAKSMISSLAIGAAVSSAGVGGFSIGTAVVTTLSAAFVTLTGVFILFASNSKDVSEPPKKDEVEIIEQKPIQDIPKITETESNLDKGFTYADFSECGMKIPVPPKTDQYYKIISPGDSNSNIRQWLFSNRSDEAPFYKLNTYGDTNSGLAGIFTTDKNNTILGGGGVFGTITILCTENINKINLDQALAEFSDAITQLNAGRTDFSEVKEFKVEVKEKTNFAGFDTYLVGIVGGAGESFGGYLFVTPEYIRLIRVTNDFDQFATETITQMKDNLVFNERE